jgi:exosome complex RNA-binding protein Rrp42 (RNase PH superfamily)
MLVADPSAEEEVAMDGSLMLSINAHRYIDA